MIGTIKNNPLSPHVVILIDMSRTIEAEYVAEEKVLKLTEPLTGVRNHEMVRVTLDDGIVVPERGDWPTVSEEGGRDLAQAVREAFGRDIA